MTPARRMTEKTVIVKIKTSLQTGMPISKQRGTRDVFTSLYFTHFVFVLVYITPKMS